MIANAKLLWNRVDEKRGWLQLAQVALFSATFLILTIYALTHTKIITNPTLDSVAVGIPWIAAALFSFEKAKKIFGNPLSYDLSKYVRDLKYEDKVAFIDRFQDDFSDIVKSYVGDRGRVFIFIDDLDRCEVPRAAELLQAINLLLSADQGNLFFILGVDREMVAAGIAAKNEKILPYLGASRSMSTSEKLDAYRIGIDYGYNFVEKFIQVPFRVPSPDEREITSWVSTLLKAEQAGDLSPAGTPAKSATIDIRSGSDPEDFEQVVEKIAQIFAFNPRRLKQFINVFRLQVMIALSTGVLAPARQGAGGPALSDGITIQQLGLFTAVLMRWSRLAGDLIREPQLFDQLLSDAPVAAKGFSEWSTDIELRKAIDLDSAYSLRGVNLRPLLMIMPDSYAGGIGAQGAKLEKTRLVAGLGALPSDANTSNIASSNSSNFSQGDRPQSSSTGPTGPGGPAVA